MIKPSISNKIQAVSDSQLGFAEKQIQLSQLAPEFEVGDEVIIKATGHKAKVTDKDSDFETGEYWVQSKDSLGYIQASARDLTLFKRVV